MSELFRYNVEKLSNSDDFKNEHQMESFLYNNPNILGEFLDEKGNYLDPAVIQQFYTQKGKGREGRIDLMALASNIDGTPVLKIIELKVSALKEDFKQLKDYLEGLNDKNKHKKEIINFILDEGKIEDDDIAENCYNNPIGIFIVSNFDLELLIAINDWNKNVSNSPIDLYKLLLFKTTESTYVVLDKIVEVASVKKIKRVAPSWVDFATMFDDIKIGNVFYIKTEFTNGDNIEFKITDQKKLVILTPETIKLMREKAYLSKAKDFGSNPKNLEGFKDPEYLSTEYFPKIVWNYQPFKTIFSAEIDIKDASNERITVTNLVQLVLLANEKRLSGWVWSNKITHQKTGRDYLYYRDLYKKRII